MPFGNCASIAFTLTVGLRTWEGSEASKIKPKGWGQKLPLDVPVVIIGAGTVGLFLAVSLARARISTVVVETGGYVNNPLERILREIRRRTRVVGAFPDGQSALNLAAARLRHIAGTAWSTKRYLNIEFVKDQEMTKYRHRVSQGRAPLSQPKVRKTVDATGNLALTRNMRA
jgi:choline dehydrogenase-like flavoprotein